VPEALQIGGPGDPLAGVWATVQAAAAETPAYAVGGPVRDLLRGDPHRDADVAVEGDAVAVARRVATAIAGARLTVHAAFGTAVIVAPGGVRIDIAAARSERYPAPAALPQVSPATIAEDLRRRDFTVNALAAALGGERFGEVLDPFDGRSDLAAGLIRVLHPASFRDDPTRLYRAVRYAARLGYALEPDTEALARAAVAAGMVDLLSGARLRAEVVALLRESTATLAAALPAAEALGLLAAVDPALGGEAAARVGRLARFDDLRGRLGILAPPWRGRLAAIAAGADDVAVERMAQRLRLDRRSATVVRAAATAPARLGARLAAASTPADVAEPLDRLPIEAALVVAADGGPAAAAAEHYLDHLRGIRLEIDGAVLRDELGLVQSPRVGEVLAELLRRKRNGQLADRGSELAAARELVGRAAS
jgi:tRNA nucleotidyltransferase (CCA-adding enzyme)